MAKRAALPFSKRVGFVTLNAGLCALAASAWFLVFPDFPLEITLVVPPLGVISLLTAAALHELILRTSSRLGRALALYAAFVATLVLYAMFLRATGIVLASSESDLESCLYMVCVCLDFGHLYGLPALLVMGIINQRFSRVLCPRPA